MKTRLILLLGVLFLFGCGHFLPPLKDGQSQSQVPSLRDDEVFILAVEDFRVSRRADSLQAFVQGYPESQLVPAAESLLEYAGQLEQSSKDATDQQSRDKQLKQKVATLTAENSKLVQQLEQLKLLLIELEKRP